MSPTAKGTPAQNGVLPMPTATLQKNAPPRVPKPVSPKLKVVIRRLAPGLTQNEFESALGDEWKCGAGKVDWITYRPGHISTDAANPSLPSRAYLRVTDKAHIPALNQHVKQTPFLDSKNSARDPALIGPPMLDVALFQKAPAGKRKADQRQGLIDQDPDFKAFLESLTNPITKPAPIDAIGEASTAKPTEKVTVTPLIQHLREKKKAQEAAKEAAKSKGKGGKKEAKAEKAVDKKTAKAAKDAVASPTKPKRGAKAEKAPVKVLAKESPSGTSTGQAQAAAGAIPTGPATERKRERGNASLAAKIVQRDLGVLPSRGARGKGGAGNREAAANAESGSAASTPVSTDGSPGATTTPSRSAAATAKDPSKPAKAPRVRGSRGGAKSGANAGAAATEKGSRTGSPAQTAATPSTKNPAAAGTPTAPAILKKGAGPAATTPTTAPNAPATARKPAQPTAPLTTATQAFLKHANPSQGITVDLLNAALAAHGTVVSCEIDRKKGYAYAEFATHAELLAAVAASPIKVADGAVEVLVRKEKGGKGPSGGTGAQGGGAGAQGGRGGHSGKGRGRGRWGQGGKGGTSATAADGGAGAANAAAAPAGGSKAPT